MNVGCVPVQVCMYEFTCTFCVYICVHGVSESYLGGFAFFLTVFQRKRICVSTPVSFSMPTSEMPVVVTEVL